jgi:hypothetical protein
MVKLIAQDAIAIILKEGKKLLFLPENQYGYYPDIRFYRAGNNNEFNGVTRYYSGSEAGK